MALIKCPSCGAEISEAAYKCPTCGALNVKNTVIGTSQTHNVQRSSNATKVSGKNKKNSLGLFSVIIAGLYLITSICEPIARSIIFYRSKNGYYDYVSSFADILNRFYMISNIFSFLILACFIGTWLFSYKRESDSRLRMIAPLFLAITPIITIILNYILNAILNHL